MKAIMNKMLKQIPKKLDINNFVFLCSNNFKDKIKSHKGIEIFYSEFLPKNYVSLLNKKDYENSIH